MLYFISTIGMDGNGYVCTALGPQATKAVPAVKALQLLDDLYKLSKLR